MLIEASLFIRVSTIIEFFILFVKEEKVRLLKFGTKVILKTDIKKI